MASSDDWTKEGLHFKTREEDHPGSTEEDTKEQHEDNAGSEKPVVTTIKGQVAGAFSLNQTHAEKAAEADPDVLRAVVAEAVSSLAAETAGTESLANLLKEAASEAAASVTSASAYVDKDFSMDGLEQQIEEMAASNQEKADKAVQMLRASAAAENAVLRAAGAAAAATAAAAVGSSTTKKSTDTAGSSQPEAATAATAAAAPPPEAAATAASTPPSTSTAAAAEALHDEVIEAGAPANPRPPTPTPETGLFGVPAHVPQFAGVAKGKKKKKFYKRF